MKNLAIILLVAIMAMLFSTETSAQYKKTDSEKIAESLKKEIGSASKLMEARILEEWMDEVITGTYKSRGQRYNHTTKTWYYECWDYVALQIENGVVEIITYEKRINRTARLIEKKYYFNNRLIILEINSDPESDSPKKYSATKDSYKSQKARININSNLSDFEKEVLLKSMKRFESSTTNCDGFLKKLNNVIIGKPNYYTFNEPSFCQVYVKEGFVLESKTRPVLEKVMRYQIDRAKDKKEKEKYSDIN